MTGEPIGDGPLVGRSVVVTRARSQASSLAALLAGRGATVIELAVIAFDGPADGGAALADAADRLVAGAYGWTVLTSQNSLARLLTAVDGRPLSSSIRWAAVGPGTAGALVDAGIRVDLVPAVGDADALADAFPQPGPDERPVLFPRAERVSGRFAVRAVAKGWKVDEVVAYRTVAAEPDPDALSAALGADAIAFTSSSTVERSVDQLGIDGVPPVVVTMGPATSGTARAAGLTVSAEADPRTLDGLVDAIELALAPRHP